MAFIKWYAKIYEKTIAFINKLENLNIPLWACFLEFFLVALARDVIEVNTMHYKYDYIMYFHVIVYFFYIVIFMLMMTVLITKESIKKVSRAFFWGILIIIPMPLIDKYIFHRTQWYGYLQPNNWANITLSFFQSNPEIASRGHQIEFAIIFSLLLLYIFIKTRYKGSYFRSLLFSFSYVFLIYVGVMWLSTPKLSPLYKWIYGNFRYFTIYGKLAIDYPYYVYIFVYVFTSLIFLGVMYFYLAIAHIQKNKPLKIKLFDSIKKNAGRLVILSFFIITIFYILPHGIPLMFNDLYGRANIIIFSVSLLSVLIIIFTATFLKNIISKKLQDHIGALLMIAAIFSLVMGYIAAAYLYILIILLFLLLSRYDRHIHLLTEFFVLPIIYISFVNCVFYPEILRHIDYVKLFIIFVINIIVVFFVNVYESKKIYGGDSIEYLL